MITVVVAIISTALMVSQHLSIFETTLVNTNMQMLAASAGAVDTQRQQLLMLADKNKRKIPTANGVLPAFSFAGIRLKGQLWDAMGFFNINCLTQTANVPAFARLIQVVDSSFDKKSAMAVALQVSAWVRSRGNRGIDYKPGVRYQLAHRPMANISELRLVSGVTQALMTALAPYVIALPPEAKVNLNAVSAPVLFALFKDKKKVTFSKVKSILSCRKDNKGFKSAKIFTKCLTAQNIGSQAIDDKLIAYDSEYFLSQVTAAKGIQHLAVTSLLYIGEKMPQWQSSASATTKTKTKTTPADTSSARLLNQAAARAASDSGASKSLSANKKPKLPLHSFVLWQSW